MRIVARFHRIFERREAATKQPHYLICNDWIASKKLSDDSFLSKNGIFWKWSNLAKAANSGEEVSGQK